MQFRKIISSSLSPNTQVDDVREAIRVLFNPMSWQRGGVVDKIENWFKNYFETSTTVSFDSGRSALLAILQAFAIGHGDEVLMQAFTCVAVPNSVRWVGATPVYVDIDESFNINLKDLKKKITKQSKAIIVQHTFGIPAQMDAIVQFAKVNNLLVIEDCAHSLGATYNHRKIGTLGDAAFFSFGRDKVVSSVWGGMATISQKSPPKADQPMAENAKFKLKKVQEDLSYPSRGWIVQQLFHPLVFAAVLPTYNIALGKALLEIVKQSGLISVPVYEVEKRGQRPLFMPKRYPNALAQLLAIQLTKLERYNDQRRRIASYYWGMLKSRKDIIVPKFDTEGVYLRFPILVEDQGTLTRQAKQQGVLLGNWYQHVIDPKGVDLSLIGYSQGSCPRAEDAAQRIINLPTLISQHDAQQIISLIP
ncbi:MAG: aminotransferase class I/II-fold pyridoxal phosphate-dependent enzyme [Patescibacteria group bacterium]